MKKITINNKEYTLEYSIEASLYDECTISVMDVFVKAGMSEAYAKNGDAKAAMDEILSTMAGLPNRVVTLFYAGLLEHHGENGDKSVLSRNDAKKLVSSYIREEKKSYADVNTELMEIIVEDNFFDLIGLNQILDTEIKPKRGRKKKETEDGVTTSER